jgi:uncharacterized damage-inducible protein DinB
MSFEDPCEAMRGMDQRFRSFSPTCPPKKRCSPLPKAHTPWELVVHMTSWSNIALRRINGGQAEPFDGEDWPVVHGFTADNWNSARESLTESYERLSEVVLGMTDEELDAKAPKSERTIAAMINGVVQHAAYHGGQIALLKKSVSTHHRRTAL